MKSLLLTAALIAAPLCSFAQQSKFDSPVQSKAEEVMKVNTMTTLNPSLQKLDASLRVKNNVAPGPRKSKENGVYYGVPGGTYVYGIDQDWRSYTADVLMVPPLYELIFTNQCRKPAMAVWSINGTEYDAEEDGNFSFGSLAYQRPSGTNMRNQYYVPTISMGDLSYEWGELNADNGGFMMVAREYEPVTKYIIDQLYSGWSDGGYIYGSTEVTFKDDPNVYLMTSIEQYFEKPATSMSIKNILVYTLADAKIPEAGLKMYICNAGKSQNSAGEEIDVPTDTLATFTALPSDLVTLTNGGGTLVFSNKEIDFLGNEVEVPCTVKDAYFICIDGLQDEGVDLNILGSSVYDESEPFVGARVNLINKETGEYDGYTSWKNVYWPLCVNAFTDVVTVHETLWGNDGTEYNGLNIITVPTAGGSSLDVEDEEANTFAYVSTYLDWEDEEGNTNYYIDDAPEWITEIGYSEQDRYDEDYAGGFTYVFFTAEPLPAGETGRYAEVHITGTGTTSRTIYVIQGDVDTSNFNKEDQQIENTTFDFVAAGQAGETLTKENLNFQVNMGEGKEDRTNRDFRGYKDYTGTILPAQCQVALCEEMKFDEGGLIVGQNRYFCVYGLETGQYVKIWYDGVPEGQTPTFCSGTSVDTQASIDGEQLVSAVSPIPSGAAIKIDQAGEKNYVVMSVFAGMRIRQVVIGNSEATGIEEVIVPERKANNAIYNLAGQRIATPVSGQIYIKNGRKFIMK